MNKKRYISLKIISLLAFCVWGASHQSIAANHFRSVCKIVTRYTTRQITKSLPKSKKFTPKAIGYLARSRRTLQNVTIPSYAKRSIIYFKPAQSNYNKPKSYGAWCYTTMGVCGVAAITLYETKYNKPTISVDGKRYLLYQQLATTTAGLAAISFSCPPAGFFIGVGALATGVLLLVVVNENSRGSQTQTQPQVQKYIPAPRTLSPYWQRRGLERVKPKGGRKRWKGPKGRLYEWDYDHGEIEEFDKTGKDHKGGYDAEDGHQRSPADPNKHIEP